MNERHQKQGEDIPWLDQLMSLDLDGRDDNAQISIDSDTEQRYFQLLEGRDSGKAITNLSEYMLMTQAMGGKTKNAAFWFRLGLKYFERV